MASVTKYPSTTSSSAGDLGGSPPAWSNPNNAQTSNDTYAIAITGNTDDTDSQYLVATNFGFEIPTNARIDGILVEVESKVDIGTGTWSASIVKAGTPQYATKRNSGTGAVTTTEGYTPIPATSGDTDLWSTGWDASEINNSGFGVAISVTGENKTFSLDTVRITVYYTEAVSIPTITGISSITGVSSITL